MNYSGALRGTTANLEPRAKIGFDCRSLSYLRVLAFVVSSIRGEFAPGLCLRNEPNMDTSEPRRFVLKVRRCNSVSRSKFEELSRALAPRSDNSSLVTHHGSFSGPDWSIE